jgi:hypothetical protein
MEAKPPVNGLATDMVILCDSRESIIATIRIAILSAGARPRRDHHHHRHRPSDHRHRRRRETH